MCCYCCYSSCRNDCISRAILAGDRERGMDDVFEKGTKGGRHADVMFGPDRNGRVVDHLKRVANVLLLLFSLLPPTLLLTAAVLFNRLFCFPAAYNKYNRQQQQQQ